MTTQISGTTGVSQVQPGVVVDASLNLTANSAPIKTALNASGNAPIYACRAWVNFNGTGTIVIRASGNVVGVTDNGVGDYTVNFTTAMPSVNYAASFSLGNGTAPNPATGSIPTLSAPTTAPSASSFRMLSAQGASGATPGQAIDVPYATLTFTH